MAGDRFLSLTITPLTRRRLKNFQANKRGYWSLWVFLLLFILALFAEFIANDKPLLIGFKGEMFLPVFITYPETTFGGEFETEADYRDPFVAELIAKADGWTIWPLIRYSYRTINYELPVPAPAPPSTENWLGTDDQGRDVLARLIYGFRISVLFGLILTIFSSIIGVMAGAVQGYFGGWTDLALSRLFELWAAIPSFFLILTAAAFFPPSLFFVMIIIGLTSWVNIARLTRSQFLQVRSYDYVAAARSLGYSNARIMSRHILPNAIGPILIPVAFGVAGAILAESGLSFLGVGVPAEVITWGTLLAGARSNAAAWWLVVMPGLAIFATVTLYNLLGDGLRDALDPKLRGADG